MVKDEKLGVRRLAFLVRNIFTFHVSQMFIK